MNTFNNSYQDTRGLAERSYSFCEAVLEGLAPGGGLFVPKVIPALTLDEICGLAQLSYAEQAAHIYKRFGIDMPDDTVDALMAASYGDNFDDERIAPIVEVGTGMHLLELWHGPTSAFKDMALQCLPQFFSASIDELRKRGQAKEDYLILVATSGDTGKAALEGFKDRNHIDIMVFYPDGGVSDIQFAQMATQRGDNVGVFGVRGNFDDCQTNVKTTFNDEAFNQELLQTKNIKLSSANSINWGRLLPQIVYYVSSYATMVAEGAITAGSPIDVCVPTGNFGNILAAYYAKTMGTPIDRLLCASNENRVLSDFINTGTYDISDREFVLTPSPSMDILVSSNLERQLYELTGRDGEAIRTWMNDLKTEKKFQVDKETFAKMREHYLADSVSNEECFETIREVFTTHHYLIDPHTAVAYRVAEKLKGDNPVLIASTAHWAKFGANVYRALYDIAPGAPLPDDIEALGGMKLNEYLATETQASPVPAGLAELGNLPIRFKEVVDGTAGAVQEAVREFLG